jgi:hypothetical protein
MSSVEAMADGVVQAIQQYVRNAIAPLEKQVADLQQQVADLERERTKTLADAFEGPWLAGRDYKRGALVQHRETSWLCLDDTREKPGSSSSWRSLAR